jgi:hypothetical protein
MPRLLHASIVDRFSNQPFSNRRAPPGAGRPHAAKAGVPLL